MNFICTFNYFPLQIEKCLLTSWILPETYTPGSWTGLPIESLLLSVWLLQDSGTSHCLPTTRTKDLQIPTVSFINLWVFSWTARWNNQLEKNWKNIANHILSFSSSSRPLNFGITSARASKGSLQRKSWPQAKTIWDL